MLRFGNKLNEKVCCGFIFANLFNSLYLLVRLMATNFQDLVAIVKNLVALAPVLGTISHPEHAAVKWTILLYGFHCSLILKVVNNLVIQTGFHCILTI